MATTTAPTAPEAPSAAAILGAWLGRLLSPLALPIGSIILAFLVGRCHRLLTGGDPIAAYLALDLRRHGTALHWHSLSGVTDLRDHRSALR